MEQISEQEPQPRPNPFRNIPYHLLCYPLINAELTVLTHRINPQLQKRGIRYTSFLANYECLAQKLRTKGLGSLYLGFIPFMFAKCEVELSDYISKYLESVGIKPKEDTDANLGYNMIDFFLCTLVSEFIPAVLVNPINTLLVRLACDDENKQYFTFIDCFFDILAKQGFLEGFCLGICSKLGYKFVKVIVSTLQYKYKLKEDFGSPRWSSASFLLVLLRTVLSRPLSGLAGWRMYGYRGGAFEKVEEFDSFFISDQGLQAVLLEGIFSYVGSMIFDRGEA